MIVPPAGERDEDSSKCRGDRGPREAAEAGEKSAGVTEICRGDEGQPGSSECFPTLLSQLSVPGIIRGVVESIGDLDAPDAAATRPSEVLRAGSQPDR